MGYTQGSEHQGHMTEVNTAKPVVSNNRLCVKQSEKICLAHLALCGKLAVNLVSNDFVVISRLLLCGFIEMIRT